MTFDYNLVADFWDEYVNHTDDIEFWVKVCEGAKSILELGCGTGRLTIPLVKQIEGWEYYAAVDYSCKMLNKLNYKLQQEEHIKQPNIIEANIHTLDLQKKFDVIILPLNSFNELVDPGKALESIKKHLKEDGKFVLQCWNPLPVQIEKTFGLRAHIPHCMNPILIWNREEVLLNETRQPVMVKQIQRYEFYKNYELDKTLLNVSDIHLYDTVQLAEMLYNCGFVMVDTWGDYDFGKYNALVSPHILVEYKHKE